MECKQAQKMAKSLIDNSLSKETLREFYFHIKNCPSCYDEVSKEYLLFNMLDISKDNDKEIEEDFNKFINNLKKLFYTDDLRKIFVYVADTLVILAIIISIISMFAIVWQY